MRGLKVHKNIAVSVTKLTHSLRVGFISSHLTADKLIPVNPRAITGPPKMGLLLEAKSVTALIIKPRLILVSHTDDLGWYITSNQHGKIFVQNLPARDRVGRVIDCGVRGLGFKSPGSILTSRTETSSLSRVVRDGWDPYSVPVSGQKKWSPAVESSTWPLNSHNCSENYTKTKNKKTKRSVRKPNVMPRQLPYCTTDSIPIDLMFQVTFPTHTQVFNCLSHQNDCRQR